MDKPPEQYQKIKVERTNYAEAKLSKHVKSIDEQKLGSPKETEDSGNENSTCVHGAAVWEIFQREDVPKLVQFLNSHNRHSENQLVKFTFFLSKSQKKQLKEKFDAHIEPWTFEQHLGEAVFIPAVCPHQVGNRQSCIKVVLDFISPENAEEYVRLTQEFRRLPRDHRASEDKLELKKLVLHAASSATKEAKNLMEKSTPFDISD
ncbi:PREDICTED: lysine-specific demethylase JMJ25-like isoform X1 [Camelina sativa]|uniref:Lysine-specific demethylase JMJ25-like isoform X1 n=1 Tax=Camelina sativa TaxID=90675 RepID=A0ABM1RMA3_CAMSA|nr:PREDICTED: lysine-specific demethylase JMJ25-like isoform X1 [Camelina sativa]